MSKYYRIYKLNKYEYAKLMQVKDVVNYCMNLDNKEYWGATNDILKYIVSVSNSAKFIKKKRRKSTKLYITLCRVFGIQYVYSKNLTTKEAIKNAISNDVSYNNTIVESEIDRIISMRILGKSDIFYNKE